MKTRVVTEKRTSVFTAPEALVSNGLEEISQQTDIWGCGLIIYYISYLQHPFYHTNTAEMINKISEGIIRKY
jgi:serine/threonine protein kinase